MITKKGLKTFLLLLILVVFLVVSCVEHDKLELLSYAKVKRLVSQGGGTIEIWHGETYDTATKMNMNDNNNYKIPQRIEDRIREDINMRRTETFDYSVRLDICYNNLPDGLKNSECYLIAIVFY